MTVLIKEVCVLAGLLYTLFNWFKINRDLEIIMLFIAGMEVMNEMTTQFSIPVKRDTLIGKWLLLQYIGPWQTSP